METGIQKSAARAVLQLHVQLRAGYAITVVAAHAGHAASDRIVNRHPQRSSSSDHRSLSCLVYARQIVFGRFLKIMAQTNRMEGCRQNQGTGEIPGQNSFRDNLVPPLASMEFR